MFSQIWLRLKEMIRRMFGSNTIEQKLHIAPVISGKMENAIKEWSALYEGKAPWVHEPTNTDPSRVVSLGLPAMIASEKARTALIELKSEITTPTEDVEVANPNYKEPEPDALGNVIPTMEPKTITEARPKTNVKRAEFLNKQYKEKILKRLRVNVEYSISKGGLVFKPYVILNDMKSEGEDSSYPNAQIECDFIQADRFYPLAYDANKRITEAAFLQTKADKDNVYRRLEYHKWENNTVTVMNMAFKSTNGNMDALNGVDLGQEIPLTDVPEWKDLKPKVTIKNVDCPLFAYFKMPEANTVDMDSPLGVSGYSRAIPLIKDADMQYSRLLWEYEGGELAIDVDRDALKLDIDANGKDRTVLTTLQQRLYRKVDISQTGETYFPYAPSLRDSSYIQGLNTILMRIEDVCAISRGTLSDAAQEARTATELKILKQRSYQANADIQATLEDTLKEVVHIMNIYCDLYNITPSGEYDVNFEWDDSIIVDIDVELNKRILLQQNGLASKVENRMWYFGETERQATEALQKIDSENMADMQNELTVRTNEINRTEEAKNNNNVE